MNKYSLLPNILILTSVLTGGLLFFVGLAIPDHHDNIKFGYETCFFVLTLGYVIRHKKIQQLITLFFLVILYNLQILKRGPFQLQSTDYFYYFARQYSFYVIIIALVSLLPTLIDKYRLPPLTNEANLKNSTIIFTSLALIFVFQTIVRLT